MISVAIHGLIECLAIILSIDARMRSAQHSLPNAQYSGSRINPGRVVPGAQA